MYSVGWFHPTLYLVRRTNIMSKLKNTEMGKGFASAIKGVSSTCRVDNLSSVDEESTISANAKSQSTFTDSQSVIQTFKAAVEMDANNINTLAIEFEKYDKLMCENNKQMGTK